MSKISEIVHIVTNEEKDNPFTVRIEKTEKVTKFNYTCMDIASFKTKDEALDLIAKINEERNNG